MAIFRSLGKNPWGERLKRIENSPNYRNGAFQNQSSTVVMNRESSFLKILVRFLKKPKNTRPSRPIPFIKTDLNTLPENSTTVVWFGHSSYLLKIAGKHILVDPVFNGYASPFRIRSAKNFDGSNFYTAEDMPRIDVLLITHDHYDHCDYETILKLDSRTSHIITSLGVGSHLEYWGINPDKITELDWNDTTEREGVKFISAPARHFSGRSFKRAKTLWASFILKAENVSVYVGGDSGYDKHFIEIGEKYGPFDLALLECGQYNEDWKEIHMMPEETAQACVDLKARILIPVHWGKFSLAFHPWNEPIERVLKRAKELEVNIATPMIGEPFEIAEKNVTTYWWRPVDNGS